MQVRLRKNVVNYENVQKLSKIFQPIQVIPKNQEVTKETNSKSSRLMCELGLIKQSSPGCFTLLPLALRALEKLIKTVDEKIQEIDGQKVNFPILINEKLWKRSGRIDEVQELFKLKDRHLHNYLLGPTHEEVASQLLAEVRNSYKSFPLKVYQITDKFRDEIKPRLGLLRSRQFTMKDMYTFDITQQNAVETYEKVSESYASIFESLSLKVSKVEGHTGSIGGSLSHEYHLVSDVGEDTLVKCTDCSNFSNSELLNNAGKCKNCEGSNMEFYKGIEVAHTFNLGTKYSKIFNSSFINKNGGSTIFEMGCFGIGLTRLLAGSIEVLSLDQEIRWPVKLAPYKLVIIPPKIGSLEDFEAETHLNSLQNALNDFKALYNDILLDDRVDMTIGKRVLMAKRVGYPFIIVLGNRIKEHPPIYELHDVNGGIRIDLSFENLLSYLNKCVF